MTTSATVGIIANPASARDIRRLVASGGAVTTHDKLNHLTRVMAGLAAGGVDRVVAMVDRSGISSGLAALAKRSFAADWPPLTFIDQPITHGAADTVTATETMRDVGVGAIVVLGGDGTNRLVAGASADIPLVSISTGTNNAFPQPVEPTVAGLAASLIAGHRGLAELGCYRAKRLVVQSAERTETGLVDVAISSADGVGSGAIWDVESVSELFLAFAEPNAVGLSSIGGHLRPRSRRIPGGLALSLGSPATVEIRPPIAPGLLTTVGVKSITDLAADMAVVPEATSGVVAIDGERMFRFGAEDRPTVTLRADGPVVADVAVTLESAAALGLLSTQTGIGGRTAPAPNQNRDRGPTSKTTRPENPRGYQRDITKPTGALHRNGADQAIRVPDPAGISLR